MLTWNFEKIRKIFSRFLGIRKLGVSARNMFSPVSNWRALNLFQLSVGTRASRDVSSEGYSEAAQVKLRSPMTISNPAPVNLAYYFCQNFKTSTLHSSIVESKFCQYFKKDPSRNFSYGSVISSSFLI